MRSLAPIAIVFCFLAATPDYSLRGWPLIGVLYRVIKAVTMAVERGERMVR